SNSLKNGLLPVEVEDHVAQFLLDHPGHPVRIDIRSSTLSVEDLGEFEFPLDPFSAYCLTRGIDQLDFLLENDAEISRFEQA
ncbi:MAG: 3-isopropylmalate dehydratase small subunit, partial [Xanthomonadales bacterium]|nr:3-isopropylmalate dehydratase small subunit [Xanthomonadales bacterium]